MEKHSDLITTETISSNQPNFNEVLNDNLEMRDDSTKNSETVELIEETL